MTTPAGREWAVMTAVERFTINENGLATTTFTVTNLQDRPASVTATVTADDVARGWFTVEEPIRLVDAGHSVSYVVRVAVPPNAPPAEYAFQLVVYSSDKAPEENPTYSSRVWLEVPGAPAPKRRSLKPIVLAASVVTVVVTAVTAVVVGLVIRDRSPRAEPTLAAPTTPPAVAVPDVLGETDVDVIADRITRAGLIPLIKYRHSGSAAGAISQEPGSAQTVAPGTPVEVVVAVVLTAPAAGSVTLELEPQWLPPVRDDIPSRVVARVGLSWEQAEPYVRRWRVVFLTHACRNLGSSRIEAVPFATDAVIVDEPRLRTIRHYTPRVSVPAGQSSPAYSCPGWAEAAHVEPLDDFGLPGPGTALLIQPALPL